MHTATKAIPSDQIEATLEGRMFGMGSVGNETYQQETPEALRVLAIQLKEQSQLLSLAANRELEKRRVYDAYKHDLQLLRERVTGFENCVKEATRASIVATKEVTWDQARSQTKKLWEQLKGEIPSVGRQPLLLLDHQLAAQPAADILSTLQKRFEQGVDKVLLLVTCWLHLLVEHELVGLVEWTDYDVARYHYFVHDQRQETLKEERRQTVDVDESQPLGQQTTYATVRDRTVRTQRYLERHVHHIVDAAVHDLETYPRRVPARVAEFLNTGVPDWLRPLLQIVSGEITTEEIIRRKTNDQTAVESTIESVIKSSPAVTIGNFALVGWSSDDLCGGDAKFYQCQDARVKEHQQMLRTAAWGTPVVAFIIVAVAGLIILGINSYKASCQERHDAYVAGLGNVAIHETLQGNSLQISGVRVPIVFSGIQVPSNDISFAQHNDPGGDERLSAFRTYRLPDNYGDIDLGPDFGVLARVHIISYVQGRAGELSMIRYAVTYYGQGAETKKEGPKQE